MDDVIDRSHRQPEGICYLGTLITDVGEGLSLCCLGSDVRLPRGMWSLLIRVAESLFYFFPRVSYLP
jgi:hypothetical protein